MFGMRRRGLSSYLLTQVITISHASLEEREGEKREGGGEDVQRTEAFE